MCALVEVEVELRLIHGDGRLEFDVVSWICVLSYLFLFLVVRDLV